MAELLKNIFYTQPYFKELCADIKKVYRSFDDKKFFKLIYDESWETLELKQRMHHTTLCIGKLFPEDFPKSLNLLLTIAVKERSKHPHFFEDLFFADFVETYGINDPDISIPALGVFTQYSSGEFAIRPFIKKYPDLVMKQMLEWSLSDNQHVRRFSSEGCRPRLPWAMGLPAFKKDPSPIIPILENLKADESEYVRKSVANNLNDISKDNPELVLNLCKKWIGKNKHTDWIIKRALRTLLKQGNDEAMKLFGFNSQNNFEIDNFNLTKSKIKIGTSLEFSFNIKNKSRKKVKLRIEYLIHYAKAKGKTSKKIFQITEREFIPGEKLVLNKKQSFKDMTTRKHHPGKHKIGIVVNGREVVTQDFVVC